MTFQWPILLMSLALIPLLAGLYLLAQRRRQRYALRFTNLALLGKVAGKGPGMRRHIPAVLFLLGAAALLTALARPTAVLAVPRNDSTVMIVMDVSGSMQADDLKPDRMAAAREAAQAFVNNLPPQTRVGLVRFSSQASVAAAPTTDRQSVLDAIDRLTPGGGTAIGDGLDLALDELKGTPNTQQGQAAPTETQSAPGVVVLMSDGTSSMGADPADASQRAVSEGIKVYTVGVGQRGAQPIVLGQRVDLDETTLQQMAADTGGKYFYAEEAGKLQQIYADLGSRLGWGEERTEVTALVCALGTLLVLAGGLLSLRWFQRLP